MQYLLDQRRRGQPDSEVCHRLTLRKPSRSSSVHTSRLNLLLDRQQTFSIQPSREPDAHVSNHQLNATSKSNHLTQACDSTGCIIVVSLIQIWAEWLGTMKRGRAILQHFLQCTIDSAITSHKWTSWTYIQLFGGNNDIQSLIHTLLCSLRDKDVDYKHHAVVVMYHWMYACKQTNKHMQCMLHTASLPSKLALQLQPYRILQCIETNIDRATLARWPYKIQLLG